MAIIVVAAFLLPRLSAHAQSLADVAKREGERRSTVKGAGKVYTNSDLASDFTKPALSSPAPVTSAKQEAAPEAKIAATEERMQVPVAAPGAEVERQAPSDKGEAYWRNKAAAIRAAIASQESQIDALEQRVQILNEGKTGTDQRERNLSSALLTKARADLVSLQQEKTRFEGLAQSKNVPAAWLQ